MTKIAVISRCPRAFMIEDIRISRDAPADVPQDVLARWVSDNRDSEVLRFLRWGGGMEALFPEGHPMRSYEVEKPPRVGGHERGAR